MSWTVTVGNGERAQMEVRIKVFFHSFYGGLGRISEVNGGRSRSNLHKSQARIFRETPLLSWRRIREGRHERHVQNVSELPHRRGFDAPAFCEYPDPDMEEENKKRPGNFRHDDWFGI